MVNEWTEFRLFLAEQRWPVPEQLEIAVFKVDAFLEGRHWADEEDARALLPVLRRQPLWGMGERVDELRMGVSTTDESGMGQRWQLGMQTAGQQRVLRLETGARCPLGEEGTVERALAKCNARVNALFEKLIPAQVLEERFREED